MVTRETAVQDVDQVGMDAAVLDDEADGQSQPENDAFAREHLAIKQTLKNIQKSETLWGSQKTGK